MKRLRQQSIERLSQVKLRQWGLLVTATLVILAIGIRKTKITAGWWGLFDDEIAVVTIESDGEGKQNVTIADPSKSVWDGLELLGVPLVLVILGAWFQRTQQEQADRIAKEQREQDYRIAKEQREQDGDETREEVLQLYFDRISTLLIDKNLMAIAAKKEAFDEIKRDGAEAKVVSSYDFSWEKDEFRSDPSKKIQFYLEIGNDRGINEVLGFSKENRSF